MIHFDWDEFKNKSNRKKHGIWFEEAIQVFDDPNASLFLDRDSSSLGEERFILLGMSSSHRVLVVVHHEKVEGRLIRIISARKATRKEIVKYEKGI